MNLALEEYGTGCVVQTSHLESSVDVDCFLALLASQALLLEVEHGDVTRRVAVRLRFLVTGGFTILYRLLSGSHIACLISLRLSLVCSDTIEAYVLSVQLVLVV